MILNETLQKTNVCDSCKYLLILPDSPNNAYDDDQKVVCRIMGGRVIDCCLRPYEVGNIRIPPWCPKDE